MTDRVQRNADAVAFARELRNRGLYALHDELMRFADAEIFASAQKETQQTAEATAIYVETERRLLHAVALCQRTLEDIANAPIGNTGKKVRFYGIELEPNQAVAIARRIIDEACAITGARRLILAIDSNSKPKTLAS